MPTLNEILNEHPCYPGLRRVARKLGRGFPRDKHIPLKTIMEALDDPLDVVWYIFTMYPQGHYYRLKVLDMLVTNNLRGAINHIKTSENINLPYLKKIGDETNSRELIAKFICEYHPEIATAPPGDCRFYTESVDKQLKSL